MYNSHHTYRLLLTPITQCQSPCMIKSIISGLHPMIILQKKKKSFVFKPKAFWMLNLNDHLYTKLMCLFVGCKFLSHRKVRTPRHFYGLSQLELCLTITNGSFTPRGCLSLLVITPHKFSLPHYSTVQLHWTSSYLTKPTQSNTKCSIGFSTMHSHPFNAMSPCICNSIRHYMLYHATCIMNATRTTKTTQFIMCHGQLS